MKRLEDLGISPAPWKHERGTVWLVHVVSGVTDAEGQLVMLTKSKCDADARLISRAPDMYEQLQNCYFALKALADKKREGAEVLNELGIIDCLLDDIESELNTASEGVMKL